MKTSCELQNFSSNFFPLHSHGNHAHFSVPGIEICIKYFLSRGHNNITAFVPEWRRYANQISLPGKALLEKLNKAGFVKFTPARRVGNQTIASYDDRYLFFFFWSKKYAGKKYFPAALTWTNQNK